MLREPPRLVIGLRAAVHGMIQNPWWIPKKARMKYVHRKAQRRQPLQQCPRAPRAKAPLRMLELQH